MSLSDLSIRNPVFAWMLMLSLIIFGSVSYKQLGISQLPDVDFPVLNLNVEWSGAAPEVIEAEIVDQIEQAVISVEGLVDLNSNIRQGRASIALEFDINRDIDAALQEVQAAISRIRLPIDVDPPTIRKQNPEDQPIIWMAVSSKDLTLRQLIEFVELEIKDRFEIISGVGEVILGGYTDRNLRIWVNNQKLAEYELTILDIRDALQKNHIESAAGSLENDQQQINLRFMGEGLSVQEIANLPINTRGGRPIYNSNLKLKDLVRVEDSLADIGRISRSSGERAVGLGIRKQRGANTVELGEKIKKTQTLVAKTLPEGMKIATVFDSTTFVKEAVEESEFTLILSGLATAIVCFLFLGSLRPTINILFSIPTSIIGTFIVMHYFGFTLNLFTILALALAIGIVVDDAIMVLENIYRHRDLGKNRKQAAIDGANEITFAAIAATLAVIAIFLPIAYMQGVIGKFFFQFAVTISAAIFISLIEAITLTPMRCSQMMEDASQRNALVRALDSIFLKIANFYKKLLGVCLQARVLVIIIALIIFITSLPLASLLRKEFIPPQDQSAFIARVETPVGSSIEYTSQAIKEVENFLIQHKDILHTFATIGGFGGGEVNSATIFITLKAKSERSRGQFEIMQEIRSKFAKRPELKMSLQDLSSRGLTARRGFPIDLNLRGPKWDVLNEKSNEIMRELQATNLVMDLDSDYRLGQPEIRIVPNRSEANKLGVNIENINNTISAAFGGIRQGKFTNAGRRYDLRIRLEDGERSIATDINKLTVRNNFGELVSLSKLINTEQVSSLQSITRKNRERSISIYANVADGKSQSEALAEAQRIANKILPTGYRVFLGGGAQAFTESFQSLNFVLILGVVVAYMVLASQFNSFLNPIIVFISMPFSLTGAFLGLYLFNQSINLYSMIGIILLMGIVKKNAILLVEFINHKRFVDNLPLKEAILEAGPIRLRPILMTTFATLAAALPPALALGPGAETRIPMAITILFGVSISAFFTLFVTPCAYSLIVRWERRE
jgi:hydrophobe/amphiphile efflux-1 (HAE1) family protein